jgi:hypothetical protein
MFVGREAEIARIEAALHSERNVILQGKYGIGRTSLAREIAGRSRSWRFVFTDFGAPGTAISTSILAELTGRSRHAAGEKRTARQLARAIASYVPPKRIARVIIVLDNVARITRPKIELMRTLHTSKHLLFIAILERFVTGEDMMRMRVVLDPAVVIGLDPLDLDASVRFFASAAAEWRLAWTDSEIDLLARIMHGYPLEMVRIVRAAQRRSRQVHP